MTKVTIEGCYDPEIYTVERVTRSEDKDGNPLVVVQSSCGHTYVYDFMPEPMPEVGMPGMCRLPH